MRLTLLSCGLFMRYQPNCSVNMRENITKGLGRIKTKRTLGRNAPYAYYYYKGRGEGKE